MPINRRKLLTLFGLGAVLGPVAMAKETSEGITFDLDRRVVFDESEELWYPILSADFIEDGDCMRIVTIDYTVAWDQNREAT